MVEVTDCGCLLAVMAQPLEIHLKVEGAICRHVSIFVLVKSLLRQIRGVVFLPVRGVFSLQTVISCPPAAESG